MSLQKLDSDGTAIQRFFMAKEAGICDCCKDGMLVVVAVGMIDRILSACLETEGVFHFFLRPPGKCNAFLNGSHFSSGWCLYCNYRVTETRCSRQLGCKARVLIQFHSARFSLTQTTLCSKATRRLPSG
jgi:hypothetical protein